MKNPSSLIDSSIYRKWLTVVTPCTIGMVLTIIGLTAALWWDARSPGEWGIILVVILLPILFFLILLEFFLRLILKDRLLLIWIIELLVIIIGAWIYFDYWLPLPIV